MIFRLDLKVFILLLFFYFTKQIRIYLIIMIFAIIHETSHIMVALLLKMKIKKVTLMPLGLYAQIYSMGDDCNKIEKKKLIVATAGPMINVLIILIIKFLNLNSEIGQLFVYSNLIIILFNLLPIYPLDGGRIIKSILNLKYSRKIANKYIYIISNVCLFFITFLFSILIYYVKNITILFVLVYLWYIVFKENKMYKTRQKIYNVIIHSR